jgi:hypothetical protein
MEYVGNILCPHCKTLNYCPCEVCQNDGKILFERSKNGYGPVLCGKCGKVIREN